MSVVRAFDRHKTNIVVEIGSRRERERFFENGVEEFTGRKARIAKYGRVQSILSKFFSVWGENLKDPVREHDDAVAFVKRGMRRGE